MASAPPISPEGSAASSPTPGVTGEAAFTARLGRRATPVVRTPLATATLHGPGRLAGRFGAFSSRLGLSQTSRWTLDASTAATEAATEPVRPPIDYWPWEAEQAPGGSDDVSVRRVADPAGARPPRPVFTDDEPDDFVPSGDDRVDALRRLLTKPKKAGGAARRSTSRSDQPVRSERGNAPASPPARPVRRGLPQVLHRKGSAPRRPQPGDIARRLRPAAVDPRTVAARPASSGVPANLPAAAAQVMAAAPSGSGESGAPGRARAERRRPDDVAPAPGRPPATPPPRVTEAAPQAAGPGPSPVARRPLDLTAAARRDPATPTRPGSPAPGRSTGLSAATPTISGAAARGAGTGLRTDAPTVAAPADPIRRAPAFPDAAAPTAGASPDQIRRTPVATDRALPPREAGPAQVVRPPAAPEAARPGGDAAPDPIRRTPTTPDATPTAGAAPDPIRRMPTSPDPTPTAGAALDPIRRTPTTPDATPVAGAALDPIRRTPALPAETARRDAAGRPEEPAPGRPSPSPEPADADGRRPDVATLPSHLATTTPRPPAATAGTAPSADGPVESPTSSPVSRLGDGTVRPTASATPAPAAATSPAERDSAPMAQRPAAGDTIRRTPGSDVHRDLPTAAAPDRGTAPHADRIAPSAEPVTGDARATTSRPHRRSADTGSRSPWPLQRSIDPAAPDVELAARTRPPTAPTSGEPPAGSEQRGPQPFDAVGRPAPPLAPRLRAVDDDERATSTPATPDIAPGARYQPTWQGDAADRAAAPSTADRSTPTRLDTPASPGRAPSSGPVTPLARSTPRDLPTSAAQSTAATSPTSASSPPSSVGPTSVTAPSPAALPSRPAAVAASGAAPASATPSWDDQPVVRRARLEDAPVRPATSFAPGSATGVPAAVPRGTTPSAPEGGRAATTEAAVAAAPRDLSAASRAAAPVESPAPRPETTHAHQDPPRATPPAAQAAAATTASTVRRRADVVGSGTEHVQAMPLRPAPPAVRRATLDGDADATDDHRAGPDARRSGPGAVRGAPDRAAADRAAADAPVRRFESVLRRTPAAPAPLPVHWRPLASAIAGERRVRVSTNAASRAALQAAGKRAATTGDVIHLAQPLSGPADAALLAHELTHVASPSPAPRFFDDERDSPEERRAEMIADVIRRSPVLPRAAAGAATPGLPRPSRHAARRAPEVLRRSVSDEASAGSAPSVTADELVQRLSGGAAPAVAGIIRRTPATPSALAGPRGRMPTAPAAVRQRRTTPTAGDPVSASTPEIAGTIRRSVASASRSGAAATATGAAAETIRRRLSNDTGPSTTTTSTETTTNGSQDVGGGDSTQSSEQRSRGWPMMTNGVDSSTLRDLTDWIVEQVEERVIRELERRGGRYRGEF